MRKISFKILLLLSFLLWLKPISSSSWSDNIKLFISDHPIVLSIVSLCSGVMMAYYMGRGDGIGESVLQIQDILGKNKYQQGNTEIYKALEELMNKLIK